MRRPQSMTSSTRWSFSSSYSRAISRCVREVAFQSSARCASPWRYSRSWWNSMPSPRRRTCSTPICERRLSVASSVYLASARKLG
jgi:hypothetical protein